MPMNALILGGMSPRHHDWVRQVAHQVGEQFDSVRFLDYRHWPDDSQMDIEHEIVQAAALAEELDEYVVIAKSIGTVVTTLAIARGLLQPKSCLFMGFPLNVVEADFPEVATSLPTLPKTIFLHNDQDPLGSYDDVQVYVHAHAPQHYLTIRTPGNTHDYEDFDLMRANLS